MKFDDFDAAMRQFELSLDERVPVSNHAIARLDGRGFTKLTKERLSFERPFDIRFHSAMKQTVEHLMTAGIPIVLAYTQSDEISLLLRKGDVPYQGRTRKLNSILAGEASGVFSLAVDHPVAFDCRLCPMKTVDHVVDYFRWRAEDAKRNGLSSFCYWALRKAGLSPRDASKQLEGGSLEEKRDLLVEHGIRYENQDDWKKYGALLHWDTVSRTGTNALTGEEVSVERGRLQWFSQMPQGSALSMFVRGQVESG